MQSSVSYRSSQVTSVCTFSHDGQKIFDGQKRFYRGEEATNQTQMILSPSNSKEKIPEMLPLMDYKNVDPLVKNPLRRTNKNNSLGRQYKIFPKHLAEDNRRPCYLRNGETFFNRFQRKSLSNQENSKCKVESSTGSISGTRNQRVVGERCHLERNSSKEPVFQPSSLNVKKGGSQRPVINLKDLNQFIPYHHFKMERLYLLKKILERGTNFTS